MGRPGRVAVVVLGVGFTITACAVAVAMMIDRWAAPPPVNQEIIIYDDFTRFDFSSAISFPDGSNGELRQTNTRNSDGRDLPFFMEVSMDLVHPQNTLLRGTLHFSAPSWRALYFCPGETHKKQSAAVTDALVAWVQAHGLKPDFTLDVMVESPDRKSCRVSLFPT
jgi:hypothetical protein